MIFSKEKVNTGRQVEVDLLKAFTVVFSMIIIHIYDYDATGFSNDFTWWLDTVMGGILAAPLFMFCMGIGMVYSRNNDPKQMMLRGLKLLTIGQVLNLFRYTLILAVKSILDSDYDYLPGQALNFSSDIMQLAGLGFILMGFLCKMNLPNWLIFIIAAIMSVCGTLLEHVESGCYAFDQFLGLFWGTDTESFFPLFNWFIFIAAGKCFGSIYQRVADKNKFYLVLAPLGMITFAAIWYLQKETSCTLFNSFDEAYYGFSWMRLPDALAVLIIAPFILSIHFLVSKILPESTLNVMSHPSKHINQYYCVSWWWIMVTYIFAWVDKSIALMSLWLNILTFTVITVVFYNNHFKERVEAFCSRHRTILVILVWVITIGVAFCAFFSYPYEQLPNQFNGYFMN